MKSIWFREEIMGKWCYRSIFFAKNNMSKGLCAFSPLGYPLPHLVWYTNDEERGGSIMDTTFQTGPDATTNTLSISKLTREHFGKTFACLAANNNATEPVATNVTIDMRCKALLSPLFHYVQWCITLQNTHTRAAEALI